MAILTQQEEADERERRRRKQLEEPVPNAYETANVYSEADDKIGFFKCGTGGGRRVIKKPDGLS